MINYIMIIPIIGLATGVSTQVANNLGANKIQQISDYIRAGFIIGILYVIIMSVLVICFQDQLLRAISFEDNTRVFLVVKHTLFIIWAYPLAFIFTMIGSLVLQAFGETRYTFVIRVSITFFTEYSYSLVNCAYPNRYNKHTRNLLALWQFY